MCRLVCLYMYVGKYVLMYIEKVTVMPFPMLLKLSAYFLAHSLPSIFYLFILHWIELS